MAKKQATPGTLIQKFREKIAIVDPTHEIYSVTLKGKSSKVQELVVRAYGFTNSETDARLGNVETILVIMAHDLGLTFTQVYTRGWVDDSGSGHLFRQVKLTFQPLVPVVEPGMSKLYNLAM